jgi:signal transduction histidine kinase
LKVARSAGSEFRSVDIREPLGRAVTGAMPEDSTRDVRVDSSQVSATPLLVRGDSASLEQLFSNVLANAVQAARPEGLVSVSAGASENDHLRVTIHDDGDGMSDDALARAGEPFFSTKAGGTGLGLAIGKRIAAAHRGTLTIESAPGVGTTVSIELPMWRADR